MKKNSQFSELLLAIKQEYPNPKCELVFKNNYQLIVAVILSAQCTDKRVNLVTPNLFNRYPDFESLAKANTAELEEIIRPCGFYHNKAKSLIAMSGDVVNKYNGVLPKSKEELKLLGGVGEKTANVVVANAYKIPSIAVDTHVFRVSNRLGLACASNVTKTQQQLEQNVPKDFWIDLHHSLVLHGRYVCKAQKPRCNECKFCKYCAYFAQNNNKSGKISAKNNKNEGKI